MKKYRYDIITFGLVLSIWGAIVTLKRTHRSYQFSMDIDWGPLHYVIGIAMIVMGVYFIYSELKKK